MRTTILKSEQKPATAARQSTEENLILKPKTVELQSKFIPRKQERFIIKQRKQM